MNCEYSPCACMFPEKWPYKQLSVLLLDCWQREYDNRPYRNFKFEINDFEERMQRKYNPVKDFQVVVRFLRERELYKMTLVGLPLLTKPFTLLYSFTESITKLRAIELRLMDLPTVFYTLLRDNATRMYVKELSFEGTHIKPVEIEALADFCANSRTLRYLNVASCKIEQYHFAILAEGIYRSTTLRGVKINRLLGGAKLLLDTAKIANIISQLIWQNKLEEIEMQQCEFIAQDIEIISEYIAIPCSKLLRLNLANNIIGPDGVKYLFQAISSSNQLRHLDISGNSIGTHGGEIVAKYLSSCYQLEQLNISYNEIGADAINFILTSMKKPIKLTKLKLYGNRYDNRSANILRRLLDARVVPQDTIDITVTFDETMADYRIIPYLE